MAEQGVCADDARPLLPQKRVLRESQDWSAAGLTSTRDNGAAEASGRNSEHIYCGTSAFFRCVHEQMELRHSKPAFYLLLYCQILCRLLISPVSDPHTVYCFPSLQVREKTIPLHSPPIEAVSPPYCYGCLTSTSIWGIYAAAHLAGDAIDFSLKAGPDQQTVIPSHGDDLSSCSRRPGVLAALLSSSGKK